MPLSPSTINDIKIELAALHELKAKIDERVHALEAILVPLDFGQSALPFLGEAAPQVIDGQHRVSVATEAIKNTFASTGLRAAILRVLRTEGPMRSPDVAHVLEKLGFQNDSHTALPVRVYNDLWRMSQKDIVTNKYGVFELMKK